MLGGRSVIQAEAVLRGDLVRTPGPNTPPTPSSVAIAMGKYCFISTGAILRPPSKLHRGLYSYHPLKVGDNVFVGPGAVVEAASVGSNVSIGKGAVIGKMAIVRDCVQILEGAVVPAGMVVGSGCVIGGRPGRVVGEVGVGWEGVDGWELWRTTAY